MTCDLKDKNCPKTESLIIKSDSKDDVEILRDQPKTEQNILFEDSNEKQKSFKKTPESKSIHDEPSNVTPSVEKTGFP